MKAKSLPHNHDTHHSQQQREFIFETLSKSENFQTLSEVFKQLDDPVRLKIFWFLCHSEECVANISASVQMTSPAVSHHLKLLKSKNLIVSRREGKEVYYKVPDTPICRLLHKCVEDVMEISCPE